MNLHPVGPSRLSEKVPAATFSILHKIATDRKNRDEDYGEVQYREIEALIPTKSFVAVQFEADAIQGSK